MPFLLSTGNYTKGFKVSAEACVVTEAQRGSHHKLAPHSAADRQVGDDTKIDDQVFAGLFHAAEQLRVLLAADVGDETA